MRTFEIQPGVGVAPIHFGMTPDEVRQMMGDPDPGSGPGGAAVEGTWTYGPLLVNTDDEGQVRYLEISNSSGARAIYKGADVFRLPMEEAARAVGDRLDESLCVDFEADVGMWSGDGEEWETIGVGNGDHFRRLWERRQAPL